MPENRIYEDLSLVRRRANIVFWIVAALVVLALSYYWKVQILDHKKYESLAEANRMRMRVLAAPRGLIRDRTGGILADNRASFKVSLVRENVKDEAASYAAISRLLGIDEPTLRGRVALHKDLQPFEPIVIADGLGPADVAPIESRRLELPELVVESEPQRYYPGGGLAAHVLGYLQEQTPEEIQARPDRKIRPGEMVGKTGVEREYDDILRGEDGRVYEEVDSLGRVRGAIEQARQYPVQGKDVRLTIDPKLQAEAERSLEGREGVIVALDAESGGVLALASSPTYDPNRFITRFTPAEWSALKTDPLSPLENRAIRGLYAPGSIFKLVMSMGGLAFGYVTEGTTVYCSGSTQIYGAVRHCWFAPGHGAMDLADAIRNSCNIYFYTLGRRMGIDPIAQAATRLGLGRKTGIDLVGEKEGLVPSSQWKMETLKTPWYPGETISVAIGQGQLQVTPMQIAAMTALIAGRGTAKRPHLRDGITPAVVGDEAQGSDVAPEFTRANYEGVIAGMWRSVNEGGTGQGAKVPDFDVCGKTGSTQTMSRESAERLKRAGREIKTHSWFSGFAPRVGPKIVVTVLVEFGGGGGATAAPVAGRIFSLYKQELETR